jgi:hypothetical protein
MSNKVLKFEQITTEKYLQVIFSEIVMEISDAKLRPSDNSANNFSISRLGSRVDLGHTSQVRESIARGGGVGSHGRRHELQDA